MKSDNQITGNIGLYYSCYHLSLLGWNVMPTARNARGVDIIAYSQDAKRKLAIQVKALSKRDAVPLGNSIDKIMGDFWIIITGVYESPSVYVLKPSEIKKLAGQDEKDGKVSCWLGAKKYSQEKFNGKWERIGSGAEVL